MDKPAIAIYFFRDGSEAGMTRVEHKEYDDTYISDGLFFCVVVKESVIKHPLRNIMSIVENPNG